MTRARISIAIALVLISIVLIAVISKTDSSVRTLQLNLQTKDQQLDILEAEKQTIDQQLQEAKGDQKKLKEVEKKNQELQKSIEELQAKKAEEARVAAEQSQNVVMAQEQAPSVVVNGSCADWMNQAGITHTLARELIQRESGCDPHATNPSSGACGIPQALPCSKMGDGHFDSDGVWVRHDNPVVQLKWMQSYVMGRYGSWEAAIAHHNANNWY